MYLWIIKLRSMCGMRIVPILLYAPYKAKRKSGSSFSHLFLAVFPVTVFESVKENQFAKIFDHCEEKGPLQVKN